MFYFEALKAGFSQGAKGYALRLIVHPDDIPTDLIKASNNQRYMVAMVPMTDDESQGAGIEGHNALIQAAILCRTPAFQRWLYKTYNIIDVPIEENFTVQLLHKGLKITSRTEIRDNAEVRTRFLKMKEAYETSMETTYG